VDGVPYVGGAPFRFSSEDYFRLGEIGVLEEDDRVELIDGEIIEMSPEGSRHGACIRRLIRYLVPRVGKAVVGAQDSLSLPGSYWPRPDVVVLRPNEDDYEEVHPTHQDALVIVEIADSSLRYDRRVKSQRYAQAGIPEFWLVDLKRNQIFIHTDPTTGEYLNVQTRASGDVWTSAALGGLTMPVDVILKPR
jgi:Uma2 family endonuclease